MQSQRSAARFSIWNSLAVLSTTALVVPATIRGCRCGAQQHERPQRHVRRLGAFGKIFVPENPCLARRRTFQPRRIAVFDHRVVVVVGREMHSHWHDAGHSSQANLVHGQRLEQHGKAVFVAARRHDAVERRLSQELGFVIRGRNDRLTQTNNGKPLAIGTGKIADFGERVFAVRNASASEPSACCPRVARTASMKALYASAGMLSCSPGLHLFVGIARHALHSDPQR